MATWINDIVSAMSNLGGTAHYTDLYAEIKRIRTGPLPSAWKKIIQRQIQDHASESSGFKSKKLFYPVNGLGSGTWGLVPGSAGIPVPDSSTSINSIAERRDDEILTRRNAAWSRDELILALDLYMSHRTSPLTKESDEVKELSGLLNKMNASLGKPISATFRNANGVYMKLMNFRRFDPDFINVGKVGLSRGNKDEEVVWQKFSGNPAHLNQVANAIRQALGNIHDTQFGMDEDLGVQEAHEGRVLTRLHRYRERNRTIVEQRKKLALAQQGCLACEVCGFNFSDQYGEVGAGIIEVHHTKPLHTLGENGKTKLEDLVLLCANCHRVIHSSRKWLSIEQVRMAYKKNSMLEKNVKKSE